jgi:tetratricopeptide (TPR) repeat protein
MAKSRKLPVLELMLVVLTAALYWQTTRQGFMVVDDNEYVNENPWVNEGLSRDAARWAFTTFHAANWHPLTWLSHQADWSLYGSFAGGHHLTNLLLHTLNTLLLFLLLRGLTGSTWRSWVVAALFGWHPLHVESVAWISERKDLLSTLCLLGSVWAYCRYAKGGESKYAFYLLALLIFAAGIMCKPMIVTLPFLLLLLDYWPLGRISDLGLTSDKSRTSPTGIVRLLLEKVPFFALTLAGCLITLKVQHAGGAIKGTNEESILLRVLNSLSAYGAYLRQTFWPNPLCIYYPMPRQLPWAGAVAGEVLICAITLAAWLWRKKCPWLLTGWLWFAGSLVPVIGLVQVGHQSHADRYMYIPSIGLFIALVWGAWHLAEGRVYGKKIATGLAATALAACLVVTTHQLNYWNDSITLFEYAIAHNEPNYFCENDLAAALSAAGRSKEAVVHFRNAIELDPLNAGLYRNLGVELATEGDLVGAARELKHALALLPHNRVLLNNLGEILAQQGKSREALEEFQKAIREDAGFADSYVNAGMVWQGLGEAGAAVTNFSTALKLQPGSLQALDHLSYLFATCPDAQYHQPDAAIQLAARASQLTQNQSPNFLQTLAIAFAAAGQYSNAVAADERALQTAQQRAMTNLVERLQGELTTYRSGRSPAWDWKRMP